MPLFEFRCPDCTRMSELLVRRDERPACPHCGARRLERLMSAPAVGGASSPLPIAAGCPPIDAGPCGPGCCRLPGM